MKRLSIFSLAALSLFMPEAIQAQGETTGTKPGMSGFTEAGTGIFLTAKFIPQMSWMVNKDDLDSKEYEFLTKYSAGFGIGAGYVFGENAAIEVDMLYSVQGASYRLNDVEYNRRMDYIKIPLLFCFNSSPSRLMLSAKAGPQLTILSLAKTETNSPDNNGLANNKDKFEQTVMSVMIGTGARYVISSRFSVDASLRCDFSFTNVENNIHVSYPKDRAQTYNITTGLELGFNYLIPNTGLKGN